MAFQERFSSYLDREVAQRAAKSLSDGVGIEFRIRDTDEVFHFTKRDGRNQVVAGPAPSPEVVFTLTPSAAEQILSDPADEIAEIGVHIAKLMISTDANRRVGVSLKVGFFGLFTQGYLGVLKGGGTALAAFLSSKGVVGIDSIKSMIKKMKGSA